MLWFTPIFFLFLFLLMLYLSINNFSHVSSIITKQLIKRLAQWQNTMTLVRPLIPSLTLYQLSHCTSYVLLQIWRLVCKGLPFVAWMKPKSNINNSKWVWSGNTTITNCRQTHGTARKSHTTITILGTVKVLAECWGVPLLYFYLINGELYVLTESYFAYICELWII